MNATTSAAPKQRNPRPKPERFIKVLEQPGPDTDDWAAIAITMGKQVDTYLLHAIPTDFGSGCMALEVEKLDAEFNTAETYHVHLSDRPAECTCDCRGHERHGKCKHREGIQRLIEIGKLPAKPAHRSSGDMAANDPEAFRQHENDTAGLNTPREKDRHVAEELAAMEAEIN